MRELRHDGLFICRDKWCTTRSRLCGGNREEIRVQIAKVFRFWWHSSVRLSPVLLLTRSDGICFFVGRRGWLLPPTSVIITLQVFFFFLFFSAPVCPCIIQVPATLYLKTVSSRFLQKIDLSCRSLISKARNMTSVWQWYCNGYQQSCSSQKTITFLRVASITSVSNVTQSEFLGGGGAGQFMDLPLEY